MSDNSDQGTRSRTNTAAANRKKQSEQDATAQSERSSRRRTPSGNRRQQQRGASGGSKAPRGKTIPWDRKVRRFLRRVKKFFRRLLRRLQRLPLQVWLIAGGVLAAVIVIIIIMSVVSSTRRNSAAQEEAVVVAEEEETTEAGEEEEETSAATTLEQLQGIEYYTILTDSSEVGSLTYTQISPLSCTASSVLTGVSGTVFGTDNLFDNDLTTSWQEGEADDGLGVTITSTFSSGTEIIGIAFWTGNEKAQENFEANNRPQGITVSVSSSSQVYSASYTLEDYMGEQVLLFASAVPVESVVIRIDSVYEGSTYDDTVISELRFLTE